MNVGELQTQLQNEGFRNTYVWRDRPGAFYPDHTHAVETAHIILEGEMTFACGGESKTYKAGERLPNLLAGTLHSARMGPRGCRYLIGEK